MTGPDQTLMDGIIFVYCFAGWGSQTVRVRSRDNRIKIGELRK
jgi:hypothetical protein